MSATLDRKLRQANAARASGDAPKAEGLCREILRRAPRHPHALQLTASARLQQGDRGGAAELLRRALESDPDNRTILEGLGFAVLEDGDAAAAESWLRRAIGLGSRSAAVFTWLGLALSRQGRHADAAAAFRDAAAADPGDPGAYLNLGHEALELKPGYARAEFWLGMVRLFRAEFEAGWPRYERWLEVPEYRNKSFRQDIGSVESFERIPRWLGPGEPGVTDVAIWYEQGMLLRFDAVDYYNDLEELFAILEACDLLIRTSNATAHFAGALGKRTWLLYLGDQPPFHYWADAGDHHNRWYPAVEIVTGRNLTDWPSLAAEVTRRLGSLICPKTRRRERMATETGCQLQAAIAALLAHVARKPPYSA